MTNELFAIIGGMRIRVQFPGFQNGLVKKNSNALLHLMNQSKICFVLCKDPNRLLPVFTDLDVHLPINR
jgi:hypothetical protein